MPTDALVAELYQVPENGKAEIIGGKVVRMSPGGFGHGRSAGRIFTRLDLHEEQHGGGYAIPDNVGFLVSLPGRDSFSPDAAWYTGQPPVEQLDFISGAPTFAVEGRSKNDYGPKAERAIAEKIADYFAAGTLVVWDVDTRGEDVIKCFRASDPDSPTIFRRGDVAETEPAVPGWTMPVDVLFL